MRLEACVLDETNTLQTYVDSSTTLRSKTCVEEKQYHEFACSVYEVTYTIDSRDKSNSETIEFYGFVLWTGNTATPRA